MLQRFSRLHSFWKNLLVNRKQFLLISGIASVLVITAASTAVYYFANYVVSPSENDLRQPQVLESSPTPNEGDQESSASGKVEEVKGAQTIKGVETSKPIPTSTPYLVNPTTAPVQNYQTPNYQAPVIIYQPPSDSKSYSYPSPTDDWYIERLHQQQEENAKHTDYCKQVREQRNAALAPNIAKREELFRQLNEATAALDIGRINSLQDQLDEAYNEYYSIYNSFDTSCV